MSRSRHIFGICAVMLATFPLPAGAAGPYAADEVVARVDDRALTLGELMFRFANLPPLVREQYANAGGLRAFLEDTVGSLALAEQARRDGAERDPLYAALMDMRKEDVLRDLHARRTVLAQVDDAALRRRYDSEKEARFRRPETARVRHILVTPARDARAFSSDPDASSDEAARVKAERLRAELATGADFAAVARRGSEDVSAAGGGDLGWVHTGQLVPELEKAVLAAPVGQLSAVVRSPLGYHVAVVEERLPSGLLPFEAVRELLFQEMVGEQADALARAARQDRDEVLKRHKVVMHPERLP